jgi:hypothetical protein
MEYKTVKFWEEILEQYCKAKNVVNLCGIDNFGKEIWSNSVKKD